MNTETPVVVWMCVSPNLHVEILTPVQWYLDVLWKAISSSEVTRVELRDGISVLNRKDTLDHSLLFSLSVM
jgi:hypothetical protein